MTRLYTLIESHALLRFPALYKSLGIEETRFQSSRQLNKAIASRPPDIMMAEFIYGFGNNYAGVNVSNLDVSLYALQRHAPDARLIVVADRAERVHVPKLEAIFKLDAILILPVDPKRIRKVLGELGYQEV